MAEPEFPVDSDPLWKTDTKVSIPFPRFRGRLGKGMEFRVGKEGRFICKILDEYVTTFSVVEGQMYRLVLGDQTGNRIAEVRRNSVSKGGDTYSIDLVGPEGERTLILRQSPLGGEYTLQDVNKVLMQANKGTVPLALCCCAPCLVCGAFAFVIDYVDTNTRGSQSPKITRDQKSQRVIVQGGQSPLLAVCMAYGTDRLLSC